MWDGLHKAGTGTLDRRWRLYLHGLAVRTLVVGGCMLDKGGDGGCRVVAGDVG
jgi:hypothetical protein